jgi:hypothetical protein
MIVYTITTGENLAKEAKPLWQAWRNREIHRENSAIKPAPGPIAWAPDGRCPECLAAVDRYATHCSHCHATFLD